MEKELYLKASDIIWLHLKDQGKVIPFILNIDKDKAKRIDTHEMFIGDFTDKNLTVLSPYFYSSDTKQISHKNISKYLLHNFKFKSLIAKKLIDSNILSRKNVLFIQRALENSNYVKTEYSNNVNVK